MTEYAFNPSTQIDPTPGAPPTVAPIEEPVFDHHFHPATAGPTDRLIWALHQRLVALEISAKLREAPPAPKKVDPVTKVVDVNDPRTNPGIDNPATPTADVVHAPTLHSRKK